MSAAKSMYFFWTLYTVESSFFIIQLHDALPGLINEASIFFVGNARSVPSVDSVIVFRSPITIILQGVFQGNADSGFKVGMPLVNTSGACGKFILYSLSGEFCCSAVPQYVLPKAASVISIHTSRYRNNAGYTQPFFPGDAVLVGISIM